MVKHPPSKAELKRLWQDSDLPLSDFFNQRGKVFRELGLNEKLTDLTDDEKLGMLSSDGKLIKRPIATDGQQVTLGFRANQFAEAWGK
jgi:arsenate reductase (glutaredoxin)